MTAWRGDTEIVIFGRRSVMEALAAPGVEPLFVRVARSCPAEFRKDVAAASRERDVTCEIRDDRSVHEMSLEPRHDQGVAARIRMLGVTDAETFLEGLSGSATRRRTSVIALDTLTNPQNIGMAVRSAVAAGIAGVIWPTAGCPWISGLIVKSAAATIYQATIIRCSELDEAIWQFQAAGFSVGGLTGEAGTPLRDFDPPHRGLYVVGSETMGITPSIRDLLDHQLRIPMHNDVESLNAAVAASLLCFHVGPDAE